MKTNKTFYAYKHKEKEHFLGYYESCDTVFENGGDRLHYYYTFYATVNIENAIFLDTEVISEALMEQNIPMDNYDRINVVVTYEY